MASAQTVSEILPVILCGGQGDRLWPLSRPSFPKQFNAILSEETLLQSTLARIEKVPNVVDPYLLTNEDYRFLVGDQMRKSKLGAKIVIEPQRRDTAASIAAALVLAEQNRPDATMFICPSDHVISDQSIFAEAVELACELAQDIGVQDTGAQDTETQNTEIVTFGIPPDRPETGYGYIECEGVLDQSPSCGFVRFVEKPQRALAEEFVASQRYLWNSGMFVFRVSSGIDAFEKYAPAILDAAREAVRDGQEDLDFFRLGASFADCPSLSFDHAVMEQTKGKVVTLRSGWNDLGNWKTVWEEGQKDQDGVVASANAQAFASCDSLLINDREEVQLVGLGLRNIAAIATRDAVMVLDMDHAQSVKDVVEKLRDAHTHQALGSTRSFRPWGMFEQLSIGDKYHVKSIIVKPQGVLSLQSHKRRAEHWVVVDGTAHVTFGDQPDTLETKRLSENQSIYVPVGKIHRLENRSDRSLHIIEVQTGPYLGEDDIIRYEDFYGRN